MTRGSVILGSPHRGLRLEEPRTDVAPPSRALVASSAPRSGSLPASAPWSPEPRLHTPRVGHVTSRFEARSTVQHTPFARRGGPGVSREGPRPGATHRFTHARSFGPRQRPEASRELGNVREVRALVLGCRSMLPTRRISITRVSCPSRSRRTFARTPLAAGGPALHGAVPLRRAIRRSACGRSLPTACRKAEPPIVRRRAFRLGKRTRSRRPLSRRLP